MVDFAMMFISGIQSSVGSSLALLVLAMLLTLLLLFHIPFTFCKGFGRRPLKGHPQAFPIGYDRSKATRTGFASFVRANPKVNISIPKLAPDILRFVKYNVNSLRDLLRKPDNVDMITTDLLRLQPIIVAFTEVPLEKTPFREKFEHVLDRLGYTYREAYGSRAAVSENIIASRLPIAGMMRRKLDSKRSILGIQLDLEAPKDDDEGATKRPSQKAAIFVTNTDSAEMEVEVHKFIQSELQKGKYAFTLVAWGTKQDSEPKNPSIVDSFDALNWPRPPYTTWKARYRDYIYCSPEMDRLLGSYMFLTQATSHMPLVLDVHVTGITDLDRYFSFSNSSLILGGSALLFLILATIVGLYHWIKSKQIGRAHV